MARSTSANALPAIVARASAKTAFVYFGVMNRVLSVSAALLLAACATTQQEYDTVIRNAVIYDGSGADGKRGDIAIAGDRIAAVGVVRGRGRTEIDAHGLTAAP